MGCFGDLRHRLNDRFIYCLVLYSVYGDGNMSLYSFVGKAQYVKRSGLFLLVQEAIARRV
jgi:hypothetical protein